MGNPYTSSSSSSSYDDRMRRRGSFRLTMSKSNPAAIFFCDKSLTVEEPHHFLDHCFCCKTPLYIGDDIYMYKGNVPFCTEECRQEQIDIDEDEEKMRKKSKALSMRKKSMMMMMINDSTTESQEIHAKAAAETIR